MKKFYEAPEMVIESVDCMDVVTTSVVEDVHAPDKFYYDANNDNVIDLENFGL